MLTSPTRPTRTTHDRATAGAPQPCFIMELLKGVRITDYSKLKSLCTVSDSACSSRSATPSGAPAAGCVLESDQENVIVCPADLQESPAGAEQERIAAVFSCRESLSLAGLSCCLSVIAADSSEGDGHDHPVAFCGYASEPKIGNLAS